MDENFSICGLLSILFSLFFCLFFFVLKIHFLINYTGGFLCIIIKMDKETVNNNHKLPSSLLYNTEASGAEPMMKSSHVKEFLIPKRSLLVYLKFMDRESVRVSHNNVYLVTCKSAVCVCRTPGDRARDGDREDL